ncbi:hypothetical protein A5482_014555 (plasmid) [Cyanobacterium sp. IPPAS B-1200]|uniref:hypothetical protein n=1 Tax=Cyanobacterium sp. IPPAS B-1200 TaxID=1562720 RepID=UPI00114CB6DC|nr:hypothetical protein [Cyanobacterium sp. IPPAS B-1200]
MALLLVFRQNLMISAKSILNSELQLLSWHKVTLSLALRQLIKNIPRAIALYPKFISSISCYPNPDNRICSIY